MLVLVCVSNMGCVHVQYVLHEMFFLWDVCNTAVQFIVEGTARDVPVVYRLVVLSVN